MQQVKCPICDNQETQVILDLQEMPVFSNVLHDTREEALKTERAPIRLAWCRRCGFVYNALFEPERLKYDCHYENDLSVSPHFCAYARHLAAELVQRHDLNDKDIIEIGCGDGHFLGLLCAEGENRGVGFDPSYDPRRVSSDENAESVEIVPDVYSPQYRQRRTDMICCRQVLEHIHDPLGFLQELRGSLETWGDCLLFFEVPNAGHTFLRGGVWDILYEHCNYFTEESLHALFVVAGFQPLRIDERYDGQFLTIEARPASNSGGRWEDATLEHAEIQDQLVGFQGLFCHIVDSWQTWIIAEKGQDRQLAIWGSGTKGATFLNLLGLSHERLEYVVDIHPRKQGKFIPGTGQEIVSPDSLTLHQPDTIIVMNPIYLAEIRDMGRRYANNVTFVPASSVYATRR